MGFYGPSEFYEDVDYTTKLLSPTTPIHLFIHPPIDSTNTLYQALG